MELVGWDVGGAAVGLVEAGIAGGGDALVFQIENGDIDGVCSGVVCIPVAGYVDAVGELGVHARFVESVPGQVGDEAWSDTQVEDGSREGFVVGEKVDGGGGG